jgi:3'(2'), 5'-bisphosphate nucleotidase
MYDNIMKIEEDIILDAINAAIEAGCAIMKIYESDDFEIEHKSDKSPLTLADKTSDDIIKSVLENADYPILSEEGRDIDYSERKKWDNFWLVDPLDGTKEFIKKNGEFTVNIAFVSLGKPVLGIIYVPVKKELYFATTDYGAIKCFDCESVFKSIEEIRLKGVKLPIEQWDKRSIAVVGSRSHMSEPTETFIEKLRSNYSDVKLISRGSSLKLCMVAEGGAHLYPRFAPTMEWDTAAGQAIVEVSGGEVLKYPDLAPLLYNKEELKNPWFIVSMDRELLN